MSLSSDNLPILSRLFSSSVFRDLARKGHSPLFARLAAHSKLAGTCSNLACVSDFFEEAFSVLKKQGRRDEYVYKAALAQKILLGTHSLRTASMLSEFRVGSCKADLAIFNGTAAAYEVKSERDSLTRLDKQLSSYLDVFARVYVIAGDQHIDAVLESAPPDVGILTLNSRYQISTIRHAVDRPERTSSEAIFDSIRTSEAKLILRSLGISVANVPNTEMHAALRSQFVKLPPAIAHSGMVRTLKITRNLRQLSNLIEQLPQSLHMAALSFRLRKIDHPRLLSALNTKLDHAMDWA